MRYSPKTSCLIFIYCHLVPLHLVDFPVFIPDTGVTDGYGLGEGTACLNAKLIVDGGVWVNCGQCSGNTGPRGKDSC